MAIFTTLYNIISFLCSMENSRFIAPFILPLLPVPWLPIIPFLGMIPSIFLLLGIIFWRWVFYKLFDKKEKSPLWTSAWTTFVVYYPIVVILQMIFFSSVCGVIDWIESCFGFC